MPASVYKLKGWYLQLNTPPFPVHFRAARAAPDIAFKVAPHASAPQYTLAIHFERPDISLPIH